MSISETDIHKVKSSCGLPRILKEGILSLLLLLAGLVLFGNVLEVRAAFPYDMEEKNVIARALDSGPVSIYRDSARKEYKEMVPGDDFKIRVSMARAGSLYGEYESGDKTGRGWIAESVLVLDPDFENVYATVRDRMTIYSDSSCHNKKTSIRKYSGVILVSEDGDGRQVIYDRGDSYAIGWMDVEEYDNSLKYDGREKRILADGLYHFRCGYRDDENGGQKDQSKMDAYPDHEYELIHESGNIYRIFNRETGKYLRVDRRGRDKPWMLTWSAQDSDIFGLFRIERISGSFTIQNTLSGTWYAGNQEGEDLLVADPGPDSSHWRLTAGRRIGDTNKPFVFTQYDPLWCSSPYGSEGCMGTAGCGILAPVNAVYALSGQYMDVMELADYAVKKHFRIEGSGTSEGIFKALAKKFGKKYGFAWDGTGKDLKTLKKKLKEGKVAVVHVPGHYVCVTAYDEDRDKYLLLDSNYLPKREDSPYGDWIGPERLLDGYLESQGYFFYKLK